MQRAAAGALLPPVPLGPLAGPGATVAVAPLLALGAAILLTSARGAAYVPAGAPATSLAFPPGSCAGSCCLSPQDVLPCQSGDTPSRGGNPPTGRGAPPAARAPPVLGLLGVGRVLVAQQYLDQVVERKRLEAKDLASRPDGRQLPLSARGDQDQHGFSRRLFECLE